MSPREALDALMSGADVCHESWGPTQVYRRTPYGLATCWRRRDSGKLDDFVAFEMRPSAAAIWAALCEFESGWRVYHPMTIH